LCARKGTETKSKEERFICRENCVSFFSIQAGGIVTILFAVAGYFAVVGIFVRFIQFSRERDDAMHLMTSGWIQNESGIAE